MAFNSEQRPEEQEQEGKDPNAWPLDQQVNFLDNVNVICLTQLTGHINTINWESLQW